MATNKVITGEIILSKANDYAKLLNIENFHGSEGWLTNFKRRHNLKQYNKHGEASSGLSEEELKEERKNYKKL